MRLVEAERHRDGVFEHLVKGLEGSHEGTPWSSGWRNEG